MTLEGKTAIVTGAGRGIGRAIALRLAADGAGIAVNDVAADRAESVAEEVRSTGRKALAVPGDVTDQQAVEALVERTAADLGGLDIMVNNAGIVQVKPLLEVEPADLDPILRVNLHGTLFGIQAAGRWFRDHGRPGKILNAASVAGLQGYEYIGLYSATKFGVVALTQTAAKELAPHGITVNAYCPGTVGTEMWTQIDAELGGYLGRQRGETLRQYAQGAALGRVQTPTDVSNFVSYLASPDSDFMTGQAVPIDGGTVMR